MIQDPIIVTGCARSGTSMTAGILHFCGGFGGVMFGANSNNKKGMFENIAIRQNIVKPYLKSIGTDPMGQKPLPTMTQNFNVSKDKAARYRQRIVEVMKREGYDGGPWFYKGAKSCLYWFVWYLAFPNAKWIVVRRKREDIIASCMRTSFMRAYNIPRDWGVWVDHHVNCFTQMKRWHLDIKEVWPEKMIKGDFSEIEEVINWAGLEWNSNAVERFVTPNLWKGGCDVN